MNPLLESDLNNAVALLEECLVNGRKGGGRLHAWFLAEHHLIKKTVNNLNAYYEQEDRKEDTP